MIIETDSKGQDYISVGGIRITKISNVYDTYPGIRIQRYRSVDPDNNALHKGAEIPIQSKGDALDLIQAIARLS